jgi:hypothetical protein
VTVGFVAGLNALTLKVRKSSPHFLQKFAVSAPIVPHWGQNLLIISSSTYSLSNLIYRDKIIISFNDITVK